ncbi:hypothetical protein [Thermomonospora umbrina]|uniref:Uncharacterized protein n=1 Tax=Thermomonospora umbrina TaxID=111806 RepID=A0A3D9T9V1_9ACTN|nr:hypothetical protein [Thermomonospora umbrina]REF00552.1 hypothetical protein DFJ69_6101 [Thermomonospora umbrina]
MLRSTWRSPTVGNAEEIIDLIQARLDALPMRTGDIAAFLTRHHIEGRLGAVDDCPLSRYLSANVPVRYRVHVSDHQVIVVDAVFRPLYRLPLLAHHTTFLRRFDAGRFPALTTHRR